MSFLSGLASGFAKGAQQAQVMKQEKERQDILNQLAKLQGKQTELSMKLQAEGAARELKRESARDAFLGGLATESSTEGGQLSILDQLSNPATLKAGLASGVLDVGGIAALQNAQRANLWSDPEKLQALLSGAGGAGAQGGGPAGMSVTGLNIDSGGPQIRMGFPQTTVITQKQPDGSEIPVIVDKHTGAVQPVGGLGASPPALGGVGGSFMSAPPDSAKPIGMEVARKVRMPDGSIADPRASMDQIMAAGGRVLSDDDIAAEFSTKGADAVLTELDGLIDKVFKSSSLPGRLAEGLQNKYQGVVQSDPNFSLYTALSQGSLSSVIRAMGEKGALAEGDVQRALTLIPKTGPIPDSRKVAKGKIQQIRNILAKAKGRAANPEPSLSPVEGQIYEDASGNRARYVNGKYEPL